MFATIDGNGQWDIAAWWQLSAKDSPPPSPSTPYKVRFTSTPFLRSSISVWQAADDPDNPGNVERGLKPDGEGYYTITKPYVGLLWAVPSPPPQAGPVTFQSFCFRATAIL